MRKQVREHDIGAWASAFLGDLGGKTAQALAAGIEN